MPGPSSNIHPSGRGELLLWINSVCSAQYPSVESLRDGVAYCTIIEATASRVAQNCTSLLVQGAHTAQERARRAASLLNRLEWEVTLVTCVNQDPSLDSMQERSQCEKNIQILQLMLRECIPLEFSLEIDISRLAAGKLQEHIMLLKWMYQFMTKLLNTYSKSALERRVSSSAGTGSVEGVRMTRTMKLHQKMVRAKYMEPEIIESSTDKEIISEKKNYTDKNHQTQDIEKKSNIKKNSEVLSFPILRNESVFSREEESKLKRESKIIPSEDTCKSRYDTYIPSSKYFTKSTDINILSNNTRSQLPSLSVPCEYYSLLDDLRKDVESFEEFIYEAHKRHQRYLTGYQEVNEKNNFDKPTISEEFLLEKTPIISLEQLGTLLEERDKLWETLKVIHDALIQCATESDKGGKDTTVASPLMKKIVSALSPSE